MTALLSPLHRGGAGPPLLLLHGFTDTWRTWELVLPRLERRFEVIAPSLAGHAGGPPLGAGIAPDVAIVDAVEAALDEAGWEAPAIAGNSLGGYVGLHLAARGRARSVVAIAPAGGWPLGDPAIEETLRYFKVMQRLVRDAVLRAKLIASTPEGRASSTAAFASTAEHMSPDLVAWLIRGAAACEVMPLVDHAAAHGWEIDAEAITCPVRLLWGSEDRLLPLPGAAVRFRQEWLPQAEWIEIEGAGHCPQLDHPIETAELIAGFSG
ncbi:MAG: alpha/beta hydrolase [Actinobacteria bacterium]|nr:alpha/beta hydrolase [Actinomycetota bacterium]